MHVENFRRVLDAINDYPEGYDQSCWHSECGTTHCFAGWAQILAGKEPNARTARRDARVFLQLTSIEADYLFDPDRQLYEIQESFEDATFRESGYDGDNLDKNFQEDKPSC